MKVSPDQLRDELLGTFRMLANYWANIVEPDGITPLTAHDRCDGLVHSILAQLDGAGSLPGFDLVAHVHPDDEDQSYEGVVISDVLHEHYYKEPKP